MRTSEEPFSDEEVHDLLPDQASLNSTNQAIAYLPLAVQNVEGLMMGNRQAAEAALGCVLGPMARFYMNQIDARACAGNSFPSAIQPSGSFLIPPLNLGADLNPFVTRAGRERDLYLGFFVGAAPPTEEHGRGAQSGAYVGGSF